MEKCKYLAQNENNEDFDEMKECPRRLHHDDMQMLLEFKSGECIEFFEQLKSEVFDLSVINYFEKYYMQLSQLIRFMKRDYPCLDMSSQDIDILHRRLHMRDEN